MITPELWEHNRKNAVYLLNKNVSLKEMFGRNINLFLVIYDTQLYTILWKSQIKKNLGKLFELIVTCWKSMGITICILSNYPVTSQTKSIIT